MKKIFHLLWLLLLAGLFGACSSDTLSDDAPSVSGGEERVQVQLNVLLPMPTLPPSPHSRNLTDDTAIGVKSGTALANYVLLVFKDDKLLEIVHPGDTYQDEKTQTLQPKIVYDGKNGGVMKLALHPQLTGIRLMMTANIDVEDVLSQFQPEVTTWADAVAKFQKKSFTYTGFEAEQIYMPLFGHTGDETFDVKQGMAGIIQLQRCMARIVIDCGDASDHFTLETVFAYNINQTGYLAPSDQITTLPNHDRVEGSLPGDNPLRYIKGTVDTRTNTAVIYVPEITQIFKEGVENYVTNTSIILRGTYTYPPANAHDVQRKEERFYRLEFLARDYSTGTPTYEYLQELHRNTSYVFKIDYLVDKLSHFATSKEEILKQMAANAMISGELQTFSFTDQGIMDITTDNMTYLGVTDSNLHASMSADEQYYIVNVKVISNHPQGFAMQTLPEGCTTNFLPDGADWFAATKPLNPNAPQVFSIWFFFNRNIYDGALGQHNKETLYFYAGNIRKSVTIKAPRVVPIG